MLSQHSLLYASTQRMPKLKSNTNKRHSLIHYIIAVLSHMNNNYFIIHFVHQKHRRTPILILLWISICNLVLFRKTHDFFFGFFNWIFFSLNKTYSHWFTTNLTHLWFDFNCFFVETRMDDFFGHFVDCVIAVARCVRSR